MRTNPGWLVVAMCSVGAIALAAELHEGSPDVTVQMTAATLAGDCGGGGLIVPTRKSLQKADSSGPSKSKSKMRCEQTSMQLSVVSPAGATATDIRVKTVEVFDQAGKRVGELVPRTPTVWSETGVYVPWDQTVAPGKSLSVSYALSEPDWSNVKDRWNKTFVVKAVVTVGGAERTVQRDVTVSAETSLPPGVKT